MTVLSTHDLRAMLPVRDPAFTNAHRSAALARGDVDGILAVTGAERLRAQRNPLGAPLTDADILVTAELTDYGALDETIIGASITVCLNLAQAQVVAEQRDLFVHCDDELREALHG